MALSYTTISETNLGLGIDARSSENLLAPGYCEDILNGETVEKRIRKRVGYQGYAGYVPVRIFGYSQTSSPDRITFTLDDSIDLTSVEPTPLIVYGETRAGAGDFFSDPEQYYSSFSTTIRKELVPGTSTLNLDSSDHSTDSNLLFVGLASSSSTTSTDNSSLIPDAISIDQTLASVDITYTNGTGSTIDAFVYYSDKTPVAGTTYVSGITNHTGTGLETFPISAATHGLTNANILWEVYESVGGDYVKRIPDEVRIAPNGDVVVDIVSGSAFNFIVILSAAPVANVITKTVATTGALAPGETQQLNISGNESPYIFTGCYLEPTVGGILQSVIPDSIVYDEATDTHTITITNNTGSAKNIEIYYEYGFLLSNSFTVAANVTADVSDENPALTVWGFCHEQIYGANVTAGDGWVTHIDNYRRAAESRPVCGLGGNLFRSLTSFESPLTHPTLYPRLRGRAASDQTIGPAFNSPDRTRGTYTVTGAADGFVEVDSITWMSGNIVRYKLLTPGRTKTGTPIGTIYDTLTVEQAGYSIHNGEFIITAVDEADPDFLLVDVTNPSIFDGDFDEEDVGGRAGVFTDELTLVGTSPFVSGDILRSDQFGDNTNLTVIDSSGTVVRFANTVDIIDVSGGIRVAGKRTSATIPLRDSTSAATVASVVAGDMLAHAPIERLLRVISVDVTTNSITIDEELTWQDAFDNSTSLTIPHRWIPIESPASNDPQVSYFASNAYDNQPFLRSTTVNDTLFFTNGDDAVLKFDGTNNYRAGLFRWEPGLFMNVDEGATGKISNGAISFAVQGIGATGGDYFEVSEGQGTQFSPGDIIQHDDDNAYYVVTQILEDDPSPAHDHVYVTAISGSGISGTATGELIKTKLYKYYFRLNAIDANRNLIFSAMAQSEDMRVRLGNNAAVHLRILNFLNWDIYDYARLEVEIYRSLANSDNYYRLVTLPLSGEETYITYTDTESDDTLGSQEIDPGANLSGAELGTTWSEPLRAKYVSSANNSLVLANVTDWPQIDLRISNVSNTVTNADLLGDIYSFNRDDLTIGSTTNMVDTARYEFVNISGATTASLTVAADVGTVTGAPGWTAGEWVYIVDATHAASGWWQATGADTISMPGVTAAALSIDWVQATTASDIPVALGTDANYDQVNANNSTDYARLIAARRLTSAINATMVNTNVSITGQEEFTPWLVANGGNDFAGGQIIVRQPKAVIETPAFTSPTVSGYKLFVDGIQAEDTTNYSFSSLSFRSRLLVSYENFPEVFDAPLETNPGFSDSVIDVNSADGQEITGVIPFFGDSAFGAAQKSGVLLVFKTSSVYLVDITQKRLGANPNPVQKLETHGLGCTAPYSIAVTRGGVMFANESGIFRISRSLEFEYIGRFMERKWLEDANTNQLSIAHGHHYNLGQQYKLSLPIGTDTEPSEVYVYDHSDEIERRGSWVRYDNHKAIGWANLDSDAFFASTEGRVYSIRNSGSEFDFRDDNSPINCEITLRAMDFGDGARRKALANVLSHLRVLKQSNNSNLYLAADLSTSFELTEGFEVDSNDDTLDNLSDSADVKVVTIRHSMNKRKSVYIQAKYTNDGIDEPFELAGVSFKVGALKRKGILEAAETTK